jgi:hypothetical protein
MAAVSSSPNFVPDRYGNPTGAIGVRDAYSHWTAAADVYFAGDFSTTFWSKYYTLVQWMRILDFANGPGSDNVLIALKSGSLYCVAVYTNSPSPPLTTTSPVAVPANVWVHVAFVLSGTNMRIYQNGTLVNTATSLPPTNVIRTYAYIGKSLWSSNPNINGDIDDLKIFNRAITAQEVLNDFQI